MKKFPQEYLFSQLDADKIIDKQNISFCLPRFKNRSIITIKNQTCTQTLEELENKSNSDTKSIEFKCKKTFCNGTTFIAVEQKDSFRIYDMFNFCGISQDRSSFEERLGLIKIMCESHMQIGNKICVPAQCVELFSINNNCYFPQGESGYWIIQSSSKPKTSHWGCITHNRTSRMLIKRNYSTSSFQYHTIENNNTKFELQQKKGNNITLFVSTKKCTVHTSELVGKIMTFKYQNHDNCGFWEIDPTETEPDKNALDTEVWTKSVVTYMNNQLSTHTLLLFHLDTEYSMSTNMPESPPSYSPQSIPLSPHTSEPTFSPLSLPLSPPIFDPSISSYSPASPTFDPSISSYSPASPTFDPSISSYSPASPTFDPSISSYSPASPTFYPQSPTASEYDPIYSYV